MPKIIMTRGLPASGKTTWAKEQVLKSDGKTKRVNKDDLRAMINAGKWSRHSEKQILDIRNRIIDYYLSKGYDVIVDDTNLNPEHEKTLRGFTMDDQYSAGFEIKDFTGVSLDECIKRDQSRPNYVGEKVIRRMYNTFLAPKTNVAQYSIEGDEQLCQELAEIVTSISSDLLPQSGNQKEKILDAVSSAVKSPENTPLKSTIQNMTERLSRTSSSSVNRATRKSKIVTSHKEPAYNPDLPTCIIVDIDGTLAHMNGRSPYDYTKVSTDLVDKTVRDIVLNYFWEGRETDPKIPATYVVIVSGREDGCKEETIQWLSDNGILYDELHMRKHDDHRDDRIVKKEIYETAIKPRYNVRFVLDDRDRVVKMWREQGLKVLQVAEGDF